MTEQRVIIYTDGACSINPGPGGWAALLLFRDTARFISGYEPHTTNNQMELAAAIAALKVLHREAKLEVHTDSMYLKDGIQKWIRNWRIHNWRTASNGPVKNKEFWVELDRQIQSHDIQWKWVRGHSTNRYNNFVDWLARDAIIHRAGRDERMKVFELEKRIGEIAVNRKSSR
jgi:ribonuclease HI